ncbi:alpha-1,4-glucan branching enzyme [Hanseniaspora vineae]
MNENVARELMEIDPYLEPHFAVLNERKNLADEYLNRLTNNGEISLVDFARNGYKEMGFTINKDNKSIFFKEWAPNAHQAFLIGEFNNWNEFSHELTKDQYGNFSITIPSSTENFTDGFAINHNSKIKLLFVLANGDKIYRLPTHSERCTAPSEQDAMTFGHTYEARFWNPETTYQFVHKRPEFDTQVEGLKIYEAHVGISTPEPKIGSYTEFTENILPRIAKLGYNVIQLMAIMEHAYYGSFGYQVTNFFSVSSRYGTPDDLKKLIDTAHSLGIKVLLDVVHSHASKNVDDGLNMFDGSDYQYFHSIESGKGEHPLWDSRLFDYSKYETLKFLLSNLAYYIDVYQFDGFRFDGVTSMLYTHHGNLFGFSGDYNEYLSRDRSFVDYDALSYLMIANDLVHQILPGHLGITIAEDVSGYPTLCLPRHLCGVGFDYRLAMAIPDMWIKIIKELQDEQWNMGNIVHTLTNRRNAEKVVGYAESHDQALVGDKTLAFWLMDAAMYTDMSILKPLTPVIDRGIALHKLIRLITHALGGEAYLNFEGNEFGHPEWLDFPTERNGQSYYHARRQYNLVDDGLLRYKFLNEFDSAMQRLEHKYHWLKSPQAYVSLKNESDKVIVFERNGLLFVFNFHPNNSYQDYRVGVEAPGRYRIVLNSDNGLFGGHERIDDVSGEFFTTDMPWNNRANFLQVYIPCRTAIVLVKFD